MARRIFVKKTDEGTKALTAAIRIALSKVSTHEGMQASLSAAQRTVGARPSSVAAQRKRNPYRQTASEDACAPTNRPTTKYDEFPAIDWRDVESDITQRAVLLYNTRVETWHQLLQLHAVLKDNPDAAAEIVRLDQKNRAAHEELDKLNRNLQAK